MVWVNPPNRVNYTVIRRVRNVDSRKLSEFDATHLKNVQLTATVKVAEIPTSNPNRQKLQAHAHVPNLYCHLRLRLFEIWKLELGFSRAVIRSAPLDCSRELQ
jgi:hypothetical protein